MGIPIDGMRPIHPGEVLCEELLVPFGLSVDALAMAVQVPAPRINGIVRERRAPTADTGRWCGGRRCVSAAYCAPRTGTCIRR